MGITAALRCQPTHAKAGDIYSKGVERKGKTCAREDEHSGVQRTRFDMARNKMTWASHGTRWANTLTRHLGRIQRADSLTN